VPRLYEFHPDICLKTEEKARKTLSQGKKKKGEHMAVTLDIKEWKFARRNLILPIPSGRMNMTSSYVIRRTAVRQAP